MSSSPCSSVNNKTDDILYGDDNNKFIHNANNTTSNYLSQQTTSNNNNNSSNSSNNNNNSPIEITSTHNQSQTLKHFLAQKYAAESTSSDVGNGGVGNGVDVTESYTKNNPDPQSSSSSSSFSNNNSISNPFYPFSPLVSSSSNSNNHFDTRNIVLNDAVLESSIDSLHVESSTNNNNNEQQLSGHSSLFNNNNNNNNEDHLTSTIVVDDLIKQEQNIVGIKLTQSSNSTAIPTNVTSSSSTNNNVLSTTVIASNSNNNVEIIPTNLFETVNSNGDIQVDSTTTISLSQQQQQLPFSSNNFPPSPLTINGGQQSSPSVLTYGLSPNFSNGLLQLDNQHHQSNNSNMIASLASPTTIPIEHYFNNHDGGGVIVEENKKSEQQEHIILDQHQLLPSSIQSYNSVVTTNGTTNDNHFLISDNTLTENIFNDVIIHNENGYATTTTTTSATDTLEMSNLHDENVIINDLPVLTRARASLPIDYLYLQETENNTIGVFARKTITKRTLFGPIEGIIVSLQDNNQFSPNSIAYSSKYALIIFISENFLLSQVDENSSNWTRFVRPAQTPSEQNLELITKEFSPLNEVKFYFYTTRNIMPNEELKVWYSNEYAQTFNIKPLEDVQNHHHHHQTSTEINLLQENDTTTIIVENNNIKCNNKKDVIQESTATGHKLRNKIAKTQMVIQQNPTIINSNKLIENETFINLNNHHQVTLNESQLHHLFNQQQNTDITDLVTKQQQQQQIVNGKTLIIDSKITNGNNNNNNDNKPKYQCDKCQKVFPRHYSLRRHLVMHTGEKRYKCPICGMAFNHVYNRNRHIKMHKNQVNNNDTTSANNKVEESIAKNDNDNNNNNNNTDNTDEMMKNKLIDSSNGRQLINGSDGKNNQIETISSIDSSDSLSNQTKSDSTLSKTSSDLVSSSGLDKYNNSNNSMTTNNNQKNNNNKEKIHRCSQCYKRFSSKERLEKHGIVHDESAKKLSCDVCDRKFLTNSALSCHIKYHQYSEDEPRKYDCALCDKIFNNIQQRREHVSIHINQETGLFHCPKCPKTFENFSVIRKHLKSFHSNETFPCNQCPKVFPRQDKLRLHMLCHIDRWEFKCNFCQKQFKRKDKLKEHTQRMHAPDRDVRIAAKNAARMQRVKVQRTKKVATRPSQPNYHEYVYKCHLCLFGFKRRGMLVNHLAKRHPEIPYKSVPELNMPIVKTSKDYYCQYCIKVYKSSSKRKAHIIKNHPGKSLPPSNRSKTTSTNDIVNQTFSATVGKITIEPHFCDWCHKQYASKAKLMQHQRKKHPEQMQNSQSQSSSKTQSDNHINGSNNSIQQNMVGTITTTNTYKLNTIIEGDKATFTTIPIISNGTEIKAEINNEHHQLITLDASKIDQFLSPDDSPTTTASYLDSFTITNHNSYTKDNNNLIGVNNFLNGSTTTTTSLQLHQPQQIHYTIDNNSNPSFEDLMNINICQDVNVTNLNSINNQNNHNNNISCSNSNSSFTNNVITILACTNPSTGATTFTSDLNEFSDIMTHISDFQNNTKHHQLSPNNILSTNHHNHSISTAIIMNNNNNINNGDVSSSPTNNHHNHNNNNNNDLMLSGTIVEDNNWNQVVCEEMAIV